MSIGPVNLQNLQANNEGVKTTTCSEQIEKAAAEALLPVDKVKVRIWFQVFHVAYYETSLFTIFNTLLGV